MRCHIKSLHVRYVAGFNNGCPTASPLRYPLIRSLQHGDLVNNPQKDRQPVKRAPASGVACDFRNLYVRHSQQALGVW